MAFAFAGLSALWLDAPDLQHDVVVVLRPPGRVVAGQWTHVTDSAVVRDWCQPGSICHRYRAVRWHVGGGFRPPWVRLADVAQSAGERFLRTPDAGGIHARLDAFHHDRHGRRGGLWQRGQRGAPGRIDRGPGAGLVLFGKSTSTALTLPSAWRMNRETNDERYDLRTHDPADDAGHSCQPQAGGSTAQMARCAHADTRTDRDPP